MKDVFIQRIVKMLNKSEKGYWTEKGFKIRRFIDFGEAQRDFRPQKQKLLFFRLFELSTLFWLLSLNPL